MDPNLQDGVAIPAILGFANRIKAMMPETATKWMPLVVMTMGVLYAFSYRGGQSTAATLSAGITIGLAAAGLYDGTRAVFRKSGSPGDTTIRTKDGAVK